MARRRDNGMGTIYQRENGSWAGKIHEGKKADGKPKYKFFSGKTEAEVKRKIREYNRSGVRIDTKKITLTEYLDNWLKTYKRGTIKQGSYDALEKTIKNQIVPNIGHIQLQQLTSDDVQALLIDLKENKGYSHSTVKKVYDCLRAALTHACIKKDIADNPTISSSEYGKNDSRQ